MKDVTSPVDALSVRGAIDPKLPERPTMAAPSSAGTVPPFAPSGLQDAEVSLACSTLPRPLVF